MQPRCLLVANRGEIAVRILRAAADLGVRTVAVYSTDDAGSLHMRRADAAVALPAAGPRAYLDIDALVAAARASDCDAVHPGYGFLAENAAFARAVEEAGMAFVGPTPNVLEVFGDKARARELARGLDVPVLAGTAAATTIAETRRFLADNGGAVMVKAVAGGGGRGMRVVRTREELDAAWERCESEARAAFGSGDLYVERLLERARHLEVQVIGDGSGAVSHLGERECSLQRRQQKIVELAPAPGISAGLRRHLCEAAVRMAAEVRYRGVGTFEFLVDADTAAEDEATFWFLEANARLQVEHTVTEEVTGVDLVQAQLRIAAGATLEGLGLAQAEIPAARGFAVQARVNMETYAADGSVKPGGGTLAVYETPSGPGVRVDGFGCAGYTTSPAFDSLLAKIVVHSASPDPANALARARRAVGELRIEGVPTNAAFLEALLARPQVAAGTITTRFVEEHMAELLEDAAARSAAGTQARSLSSAATTTGTPSSAETTAAATAETLVGRSRAGAKVDAGDPLAVLAHGKSAASSSATVPAIGAANLSAASASSADESALRARGLVPVPAPMQGTVLSVSVESGQAVHAGAQVAVMEAMKMEHVLAAPVAGIVREVFVAGGDTVFEGHILLAMEEAEVEGMADAGVEELDLDRIRPDLAEVLERHGFGLDDARPEAVERRRKTGQRTARENIEDLCDEGTFAEYGSLVIAAQRRRRDLDDLIRRTPGDGMVCGLGRVNGERFGDERTWCVAMSYDYTVLAGTQGLQNHRKKDRMFEIAEERRLPVVLFTEGGGGRPGDTDGSGVAGLDCRAFQFFGRLSGLVPLVGINSGYCFAGNAALLGCCDVVIATRNSSIGMGGPAMIEGGGLGVFHPKEVGPVDSQFRNGVVDIVVEDEAEAVAAAKKYLSYFQGPVAEWTAADQRLLRHLIPENRLRIYDVRRVIETMADEGSMLELRAGFGAGMITALARIEGRPLGIVANNPSHLAGAIDPEGSDKAARFLQLCDAHDLPVLFLCDTPGIMVGPEIERQAMVRHAARLFVVGGSLTVPFFTIILRKGYGLGAQAMAGGSFHAPVFTVAWPTGEFGGMGLEGAVKLGFRKELEAIEDPAARRETFEAMVAHAYEIGKATNMASHFEIDEVIDPAASRERILSALRAAPAPLPRAGKKRPCVDTW